jgi:hypothetical protein
MMFKFDEQGHVIWTPKKLYQMVLESPLRLVNDYLMGGSTPRAFDKYAQYCDFVHAVAEHTGVHPRNLYLRGSCQVGFSIAPRADKVWTAMSDDSDLDLVIVDRPYFERFEEEIRRWEDRNPVQALQGRESGAFLERQRDRQFYCCRDKALPSVVCVHHRDVMAAVADLRDCGRRRDVSAFIYPDWLSARRRYENDLRLLRKGIDSGELTPPEDTPFPAKPNQAGPAPATAMPLPGGEASAAKPATPPKEQPGS